MSRGVWLDGRRVDGMTRRVTLDGRDISRECWSIDRRCGVVKLFVYDPHYGLVLKRAGRHARAAVKTRTNRGVDPQRLTIEAVE